MYVEEYGRYGRRNMIDLPFIVDPVSFVGILLQESGETTAVSSELLQMRNVAQSVQGFMTALGILAAGFWALFVFVLGRSYAPNIQIRFALKQVLSLAEGKAAVVTVKLKNIGRTHVRKRRFTVAYKVATENQITFPELTDLESLNIAESTDPLILKRRGVKWKNVLKFQEAGFEPEEEVSEEFIIPLGQATLFKVAGLFITYPSKLRATIAKLRRQKNIKVTVFTHGEIFDIRSNANWKLQGEEIKSDDRNIQSN